LTGSHVQLNATGGNAIRVRQVYGLADEAYENATVWLESGVNPENGGVNPLPESDPRGKSRQKNRSGARLACIDAPDRLWVNLKSRYCPSAKSG